MLRREIGEREHVRKFRRSGQRWWLAGGISLFALVGLSGVPASSHDDGFYPPDSAFVIGSRLFYGLMAVGSIVLVVLVLRMGLFATPSQLVVRNLIHRHAIRWDEIESFRPPVPYGAWRGTGLQILLRTGVTVHASLYSRGPFNRATFADEVIEELEAMKQRYARLHAD